MPIANDLRKTLTDPTPLYAAAGVVDKLREEAPQALAAVRETDPKEVQARLTQQAKETQVKVSETLGGLDTDIKKLREQAQHLALQGVGVAAEYAVKARETYDELAVRGREAVKNWRGESGDDTPEVTVEREPAQAVKIAEPPAEETAEGTSGAAPRGTSAGSTSGTRGSTGSAPSDKSAGKSTTAKSTGTTASKSTTGSGSAKSASGSAASSGAKKTGTTRSTTSGARKSAPKSDS
ncbi:hypothetical protein [Streptomyces sp. WMMB303]|uniref:hypothetical protein n=1 Tax=Streptomyces sp. WMMB303 TaxID=3034154 RepID=UPI0023ED35CC|nr:hypothetical protein [Streptomyces sp. WMMB303]MDF4251504.1 hypothetical protein [Streptomyces sp. WMMB303]